jgi:4-amino-4-deoxy-L-arabinose transferase-like glycosyltransferase
MTLRWRTWGVWLLPALLLVLATLRPLALPDEGRYAEVGRWMWMTGDWLTPRLDGIPFFHKPPLLYWLECRHNTVFMQRWYLVSLQHYLAPVASW